MGRNRVGEVLTATLGLMVLVASGFTLADAIFTRDPGISQNQAQLLSIIFGGVIGALAAYLGLAQPPSAQPSVITPSAKEEPPRGAAEAAATEAKGQPTTPETQAQTSQTLAALGPSGKADSGGVG